MAAMNMRLLGWSLRRRCAMVARRLGLVGCVLAVLAALLAFALAFETHLRAELVRERAAAVQLRAQATANTATQPVAMGLEKELHAFEAQLPTVDDRMQILADLFGLAQHHQLVLAKGEYRLQRDDQSDLARFQIVLPIKGDPGAIRRFVQDALAANPALAFEALVLKREHLRHEAVDAKVQLILFMRPAATVRANNVSGAAGRSS